MEILDVIAETSFGRVERVRLRDGSIGARKVCQPHASLLTNVTLEQLRKRFAREVRIQREINGNYVIPVIGADLDADPPSFIMPFADASLEQYMRQLQADHGFLLTALDQILEALSVLHALDFAHRDLKPSNILRHDGRWKLADLGLALPLATDSTKLTMSNQGWGTLAYCAPEQVTDFKSAGKPADIFAIGCILHDLFGTARRPPCQRVSAPGRIGLVIEKCTELDPKRRFQSIEKLRSAVFDVLAEPPRISTTKFSEAAEGWGAKLGDVGSMADEEIKMLALFLRDLERPTDAAAVFIACNEQNLAQLRQRDAEAWSDIATQYCEWAKTPNFNFGYCDVIVGRLMQIYRDGSVETKANAALAAAVLAESHNRWFVMGRVLDMCGADADTSLAQRLAIEIRAGEFEYEFRRCAEAIDRDLSEYHPLIRAAIEQ
jgi:hypothetical protein